MNLDFEKYMLETGIRREDVTGKRPTLIGCSICKNFFKPSQIRSHIFVEHFELINKQTEDDKKSIKQEMEHGHES